MRADEAHQYELEQRRRDEDEQWAKHRELARAFGRECRAYLNHTLKRNEPSKENEL